MAINPNWPVIMEDWAPYWNANAGDMPLDRFVEVTDRTIGPTTTKRGKQYELDQAQAGEYSAVLDNLDGSLDPLNTSGPWYGHVRPYSPYRKRAQWPPTQNLLTQVLATGGDQGGYSVGTIPTGSAGIDVFSETDSSGGQIVSSATAWQGSTVFQFSVSSGAAANARIVHTPQPGVVPGKTYTMQIQVRNVTASTTLQVKPLIGWYSASGGAPTSFTYGSTVTLTGSTTAAWTQLTVTATAPSNAAGIDVGVAIAATAAAACSIQSDGWQLEKGSSATSWVAPGVWYPLYAGFVERWPASWDLGGTHGRVKPTVIDALALLSQVKLSDPLTEEIQSHSPRFLYTLSDPQGSEAATDSTGNFPAAPVAHGKYGAGSLTFGNSVVSTDAGKAYTGSSGSVATINNPNPGTNILSGASFIKLTSAGIKGPADPTLWTRMIAFRYTGPTPTTQATLWSSMDKQRSGGQPSGSQMYFTIINSGVLQFWLYGPNGANVAFGFPNAVNVVDGDWHLAIVSYNASAATLRLSLDGVDWTFTSVNSGLTPTGIAGDNLGGYVDITVGNGTINNFKGDMSFATEFPSDLSSTDMVNIYNAWKSSFAGESSDARYSRILKYAGYNGVRALDTGLTTSMGACNIDGQDAMSALQDVVTTENGEHYVNRDGTLIFKARSARYNALTPVYTFGENVAGGEFPYEECELDYDPTHLANQVQVTQQSTSQVFTVQDAASIANYFPRSLQRTNNASSADEVQSAASYLLTRYKNPAVRVSTLKLHPSANTALWPVCLSLELGMRVRVMRRPFGGAAPIQVDCFIEQIQVDMDDKGEAWWTLQCSPADLTPYGIFAAWHTTLAASSSVGQTSITVNAPVDNINPLASQVGPGQQIVVGFGGSVPETMTVLSASSTGSPWTTGTITFTSALAHSHTSGFAISEPLPSGVTSSSTYDSSAVFDSVAFAY